METMPSHPFTHPEDVVREKIRGMIENWREESVEVIREKVRDYLIGHSYPRRVDDPRQTVDLAVFVTKRNANDIVVKASAVAPDGTRWSMKVDG